MKTNAVITGDMIHSTKMSNDNKVWVFREVDKAIKIWSSDYKMKAEIFRGDSFQCLLPDPVHALRVALLLKTYIRSLHPGNAEDIGNQQSKNATKEAASTPFMFDARIAIGVGEVDLKTKTLATSNGVAFHLSGQALDELKNSRQHFAIRSADEYDQELQTESVLLDAIIARTSALQCQVLNLKLLGYTEIEIAKQLHIMQSAVNQRSNSGNWNAIKAMVKRFEEVYSHE